MYRKVVIGGYILAVGEDLSTGAVIEESEYSDICNAVANIPRQSGKYYKLKDVTLQWDEFDEEPEEGEPTAEEILDILTGDAE